MKSVLIIIAALSILIACNSKNDGIKPQTKPLIEAVYASGFVVSKDEYEVTAQAEGYVAQKLVDEGDVVKKGDALYIIDSDQQSARNRIAQESFELAAKNFSDNSPVLRELKAAMEASKTKLQFDSANYVRYTNLLKNNATSKAEFDRMKLAFENSTNDYILQRSRYEKTKNQLAFEYQNARNNLIITSNEAGKYIIRSETNGKVFLLAKDKGELIRRNELVAVVGNNDAYYVQLNVDELDIEKIREGQETMIKIDAYPAKTFRAKISKVYPMVDRKLQSVRADAELLEQLPGDFSGLALEANVIIRKKAQAVVIPKSALLPGDSVVIKTSNGTEKIKVMKGIETMDEVEIVEGLDTSNLLVNK